MSDLPESLANDSPDAFYVLSPYVGGAMDPSVIYHRGMDRPEVSHAHYVFDGWAGDELVTSFVVYLATDSLAAGLEAVSLTGYELRTTTVSTSELFESLLESGGLPEVDRRGGLPPFQWLYITGRAGVDDFGWSVGNRLVVSRRVMEYLLTRELPDLEYWEALPEDLGFESVPSQAP